MGNCGQCDDVDPRDYTRERYHAYVCQRKAKPSDIIRQPGSADRVWVICDRKDQTEVKAGLERNCERVVGQSGVCSDGHSRIRFDVIIGGVHEVAEDQVLGP